MELVIFGRGGIRYEQCGHLHCRELRQRRSTCPADGSGCRPEDQLHLGKKGSHNGAQSQFAISSLDSRGIIRAGKVEPLKQRKESSKSRQRLNDQVVNATGALAAPYHGQDWALGVEAQRGPAFRAIPDTKLRTNRCAGDGHTTRMKAASSDWKTNKGAVDEPGQPAIGTARNRIGFVKEGLGTTGGCRQHRWRAREAAHGQHGPGMAGLKEL